MRANGSMNAQTAIDCFVLKRGIAVFFVPTARPLARLGKRSVIPLMIAADKDWRGSFVVGV